MSMPVSPLAFQLLAVCGCWRPAFCMSPCRRAIYEVFSVFAVALIYSTVFCQIVGLFDIDNIDEFIAILYLTLTMINGCCKMTNILIYRKSIAELVDRLTEDPQKPANAEEALIRDKYDKIVRINTIQYALMIESSVTSMVWNAFMVEYRNERLPYGDWLPYDYYYNKLTFNLTFAYQMLAMIMNSYAHVAGDALLCGFFIQMCCQIEILESRISSVAKGQRDILRKCAWHHENIYRLADTIAATFFIMIFSQFLISAVVICFTLYQLLKIDNIFSAEFFSIILYISTLLVQIFLYCWYANEVKLKSAHISEVVFESNWPEFNEDLKRDLIFMMQRATYPVEISLLNMVDVNVDSFMSLIKSSYSVYNILQHNQT